jgi:hypothetical protein
MAAFSLWQLLNQRQAFDDGDDSDPAEQRQAAGQAIGQSLVDLWNRADADATGRGSDRVDPDAYPYLNHLVYYPPPPGTPPIEPQLLPYRPSDRFGIDFATLGTPLAAENWAPYPGDSRAGGMPGQAGDPNIILAQSQAARRKAVEAAGAAAAAAAEWARQQADRLWKSAPPLPSDQPNTSSTAPDTTFVPEELDDPEIDPRGELDPLSQIDARTQYQKRHDALQRTLADAAKARGCDVITEVPFGIWENPRPPGRPDILFRCPPDDPAVQEVKVAKRWRLSDAQEEIYPAIEEGRSYSPDPRIEQMGLVPNTRLRPLKVLRAYKHPDKPLDVRPMYSYPPFP